MTEPSEPWERRLAERRRIVDAIADDLDSAREAFALAVAEAHADGVSFGRMAASLGMNKSHLHRLAQETEVAGAV